MNISLKKGNFIHLLITLLVYISTVIVIPLNILPYVAKELRMDIVIGTSALAAIILTIYSFYSKNSIDNSNNRSKIFLAVALGVLGFFALLFLQGLLNFLLQSLNLNATSQNTNNIVGIIKSNYLFIFYVVIVGPILEELVFRKALFGYLYDVFDGSNRFIRFFIPALITGIAFAIPHDGFSPIMIIYIVMSFIFSFMYVKTKRLITPITAHILMNGFVIAVQLLSSTFNM